LLFPLRFLPFLIQLVLSNLLLLSSLKSLLILVSLFFAEFGLSLLLELHFLFPLIEIRDVLLHLQSILPDLVLELNTHSNGIIKMKPSMIVRTASGVRRGWRVASSIVCDLVVQETGEWRYLGSRRRLRNFVVLASL
jgi:hypothetical protein